MTECKRDLKADLDILNIGGRSEDDFVYGIVAPHALERAIAAEGEIDRLKTENEEKDAEINELKDELDRINNHLFNACKDIERLRKALEGTVRIYETSDMESDFADILDGMYETCKYALGEGDTK